MPAVTLGIQQLSDAQGALVADVVGFEAQDREAYIGATSAAAAASCTGAGSSVESTCELNQTLPQYIYTVHTHHIVYLKPIDKTLRQS